MSARRSALPHRYALTPNEAATRKVIWITTSAVDYLWTPWNQVCSRVRHGLPGVCGFKWCVLAGVEHSTVGGVATPGRIRPGLADFRADESRPLQRTDPSQTPGSDPDRVGERVGWPARRAVSYRGRSVPTEPREGAAGTGGIARSRLAGILSG